MATVLVLESHYGQSFCNHLLKDNVDRDTIVYLAGNKYVIIHCNSESSNSCAISITVAIVFSNINRFNSSFHGLNCI